METVEILTFVTDLFTGLGTILIGFGVLWFASVYKEKTDREKSQ